MIVGDFNDGFVEIVAEAVASALDPGQRLRVHGTPEADRILAMAGERPVDLFVLFLNNVTFGRGAASSRPTASSRPSCWSGTSRASTAGP